MSRERGKQCVIDYKGMRTLEKFISFHFSMKERVKKIIKARKSGGRRQFVEKSMVEGLKGWLAIIFIWSALLFLLGTFGKSSLE